MKRLIIIALHPIMILAGIGFVLSLIVHLLVLFGYDLKLGNSIFFLHVCIFVVWLPAILVTSRTTANFKRKDFWKAALRECPLWLRYLVYGSFIYTFLQFFVFIYFSTGQGTHSATDPVSLRSFSAGWMVFYSVAFASLYSGIKIMKRTDVRKCMNGHVVSDLANYCEVCGASVEKRSF